MTRENRTFSWTPDGLVWDEIDWRPIPGHRGYEVSPCGRVRSWIPWRNTPLPRELKCSPNQQGYPQVALHSPGTPKIVREVHKLVAAVFIGPRPDQYETRHLDGNKLNNSVANLEYGTRSENQQDAVRHGTHASVAKTHCKWGHEFTEANTYAYRGGRHCRTCRAARDSPEVQRERRLRRLGRATARLEQRSL